MARREAALRRSPSDTRTRAPHDITDQSVLEDYPRGPGSDVLCDLMAASIDVFRDHPVNAARQAAGKGRATNVWLWGLGQAPRLRAFADEYGPRGAMITAVDLLRGIAALVGWDRIEVPGATGYLDTDYAAKGPGWRRGPQPIRYCVRSRRGLRRSLARRPLRREGEGDRRDRPPRRRPAGRSAPDARRLANHDLARSPTFLRTKVHTHGNVPVAMAGTGIAADEFTSYGDTNAAKSKLAFDEGWDAMPWFIGKK